MTDESLRTVSVTALAVIGCCQSRRIDSGSATTTCPPESSNDHFLFVEGVIQVASHLGHIEPAEAVDSCLEIMSTGSWQPAQDPKGLFEFVGEYGGVGTVLNPPALLPVYVSASCGREPDAAWVQRDRIARKISSASTSRPAAISAPDSRSAS